ncbi:MAG: hypothetical protein JNK58_12860 [Phycisphaerae bacterium]|nr:hypothetical protein [Phycisphaerae bacterium]
MTNHPAHESFEPTREDVLIGRVVDGEASTSDWDSLERIAGADASVWERLGRAQRTHARLEREVEDAIALAELIDLPSEGSIASHGFNARLRQWGGWAAAAVLGVAWLSISGITGSVGPGGNIAGVTARELSPDELLSQYMNKGQAQGRVMGEMEPMLVDARDLGANKGKELIFVRPIIERAFVTDVSVMSVQKDEHGTPRYVPMSQDMQLQIQLQMKSKEPPRNTPAGAL